MNINDEKIIIESLADIIRDGIEENYSSKSVWNFIAFHTLKKYCPDVEVEKPEDTLGINEVIYGIATMSGGSVEGIKNFFDGLITSR